MASRYDARAAAVQAEAARSHARATVVQAGAARSHAPAHDVVRALLALDSRHGQISGCA
jgi:hypothetical protein